MGMILPLATVASYVKQMASALQYAHERKLIHRDVKPENMLLGADQKLLLGDFGIAVLAQSDSQQELQNVVGTITYMAPEQLEGRPCIASDQYALGIVVYEWLSGAPPFAGSPSAVARQHRAATPTSLREKNPTISTTVERVVLRALSKQPSERYTTVEAFAAALEQTMRGEVSAQAERALPSRLFPINRKHGAPLVGREQEQELLHHLLPEIEESAPELPAQDCNTPISSPNTQSQQKPNVNQAPTPHNTMPRVVGARAAEQRGEVPCGCPYGGTGVTGAGPHACPVAGRPTHLHPIVSATPDMPIHPSFVLLTGEAGIGKTRLAEELSVSAYQRGWSVLWARSYTQENNIPYRLWHEVLRDVIAQNQWLEQKIQQHRRPYQPLASLFPELVGELLVETTSPAFHPEQGQFRLWEALHALLKALSAAFPVLIVLDDLHLADESSIAFLGYLVRHLAQQRLLVVGTCRESELDAKHPLRLLRTPLQRDQQMILLPLTPLSNPQIDALIAQVAQLPQAHTEQIQHLAAGNPFFAEELARGTPVKGGTDRKIGGTQVQHNEMVSLPESVAAVFALRISKLSKPCQQLLTKAAILGDTFSLDLMHALETSNATHALDEEQLLLLIEEALQTGILTEKGNAPHITYHFWHPLLAAYLYGTLSAARRASMHRRAGQVLVDLHAGRTTEHAGLITYHLARTSSRGKGGGEVGGGPLRLPRWSATASHKSFTA